MYTRPGRDTGLVRVGAMNDGVLALAVRGITSERLVELLSMEQAEIVIPPSYAAQQPREVRLTVACLPAPVGDERPKEVFGHLTEI